MQVKLEVLPRQLCGAGGVGWDAVLRPVQCGQNAQILDFKCTSVWQAQHVAARGMAKGVPFRFLEVRMGTFIRIAEYRVGGGMQNPKTTVRQLSKQQRVTGFHSAAFGSEDIPSSRLRLRLRRAMLRPPRERSHMESAAEHRYEREAFEVMTA
jgi:hypothetical protein